MQSSKSCSPQFGHASRCLSLDRGRIQSRGWIQSIWEWLRGMRGVRASSGKKPASPKALANQQTTAAGKRKYKQKRRLCATAPEEEFEVLSASGRRATHG